MRLVNLVIRKPELLHEITIPEDLGELRIPDLDLLLKVLEIARACPDSSTEELMSRLYASPYGVQLTQLFGKEFFTPTTGILEEFRGTLELELRKHRETRVLQDTRRRLRESNPAAVTSPGQPDGPWRV
jgi:hypothetical protein